MENKVIVVFNINGDIIGVANSEEIAIELFLERHQPEDNYFYNLATCDQIAYLEQKNRIEIYRLNEFYYK